MRYFELDIFKRKRYNVGALVNKIKKRKIKMQLTKNKNNKTNKTPVVKATDKPEWYKSRTASVIIGVTLVFIVLSIAFSTYIVWFGTTGTVPKIMLAPQMLFVASLFVWKFTK